MVDSRSSSSGATGRERGIGKALSLLVLVLVFFCALAPEVPRLEYDKEEETKSGGTWSFPPEVKPLVSSSISFSTLEIEVSQNEAMAHRFL